MKTLIVFIVGIFLTIYSPFLVHAQPEMLPDEMPKTIVDAIDIFGEFHFFNPITKETDSTNRIIKDVFLEGKGQFGQLGECDLFLKHQEIFESLATSGNIRKGTFSLITENGEEIAGFYNGMAFNSDQKYIKELKGTITRGTGPFQNCLGIFYLSLKNTGRLQAKTFIQISPRILNN